MDDIIEWLESDDIFLIKYGFVIANTFTLIFLYLIKRFRPSKKKDDDQIKNILFVTAHPDDEAMFFIPTIQTLIEQQYIIHLLCLSNGNFDGLGRIREDELTKCAKYLKFNSFKIINDKELQDGQKIQWSLDRIKHHVMEISEQENIDAIITFDDKGISGHANHIAVSKAVQQIKDKKLLLLESTNIIRKYSSIFDFFLSSIMTDDMTINLNPIIAWKSMKFHQSQFVWYRKLFVIFSRYAYINTLKRM